MLLTRESTPNTWTTREAFRIDRDRQAYIKLVQKMSVRVLDVQGQKPQGLHLLMNYCRDGFFFFFYPLQEYGFRVSSLLMTLLIDIPVLGITDLILVLVHVPCCVIYR